MTHQTCVRRDAVKANAAGPSKGTALGAFRLWSLALVTAVMAGVSGVAPVHADGALEEGPGGILHRYRKSGTARHESRASGGVRETTVRRAPRVRRTNLGGVAVEGDDLRPRRRTRSARVKWERVRQPRRKQRRVRVASLGNSFTPPLRRERTRSITGGSGRVQWVASAGCLNSRLRAVVNHVARNYGRVRVSSTCRSRRHNRRVGGARQSHHLTGNAVDFRVFGNVRGAAGYLRRLAGGFKHYGGGLFHIDTGPRRRW